MPKAKRRKVLLTGATGNWGRAVLRELHDRDAVDVVAFALPNKADRTALDEFIDMANLTVAWGDLRNYADVRRAVADVDIVLHVGAVVSPLADRDPQLTRNVNVGSMENIIRAVKSRPDQHAVEVIGIGSVAQTGDRQAPHHWGRIGDPLRVSRFDEYAQTKIVAEKLLVESGLAKWAWLRQTGIFHPGLLTIRDPIVTHPPLAGMLEWVSVEDSARLLASIAEGPTDEFWQRIYNVGGGTGWRLTNWQFQSAIGGALGVQDIRHWFDRDWFALTNFHGHWYTDSDELDRMVPFRHDTFDVALARAAATASISVRNAGRVPDWIVKTFIMRRLAYEPRGTMHAIRHHAQEEIAAFFGSEDAWRAIGDWSTFTMPEPSRTPTFLHHGYDESRAEQDWAQHDYAEAARFRGGEVVSVDVPRGASHIPIMWRCAFGHRFPASPRVVLRGGHWCPVCVRDTANYRAQAERNPFLAQVEG